MDESPWPRSLRVTMLSKHFPPWIGGLESHVAQLASSIVVTHPGVRVSVVTGQAGPARAKGEDRHGNRETGAIQAGMLEMED